MKRNSKFIFGLGLILDEENKLLHHRTMLKILLNPILRMFGKVIVSNISTKFKDGIPRYKLNGYTLKEYPKNGKNSFALFINCADISPKSKYIIPNSKTINNEYSLCFAYKLFN